MDISHLDTKPLVHGKDTCNRIFFYKTRWSVLSISAIIEVKEDFFMYKEGVYSYAGLPRRRGESSKYSKSGFHSVRIMGYALF